MPIEPDESIPPQPWRMPETGKRQGDRDLMDILHVGVGNLGPGGVRTYVLQVAEGQRRRGWNVHVTELFPDPGHEDILEHSFDSVPALVRHVALHKPDVVHLHSQIPTYRGIGRKTVLTAHEHSAYCPAGSRFLERPAKQCFHAYGTLSCLYHHYKDLCGSRHPASLVRKFRLSRRVVDFPGQWIAPSNYTRSMLVGRGLAEDRIHLLANPGPTRVPNPSQAPTRRGEFLFIGRLVPNKGCDIAIRAMSLVPAGSRLVILGEGPSRPALEELRTKLGLDDRVEFAGWQPREEVGRRLENCIALVVPSLWPEPFGLVALEAFSRARPVVASRIGGLTDIVRDQGSGLLVEPGVPEAFAEAMRSLLETPGAADDMGSNGARELEERFPLDLHLDGLERIYAIASASGEA